MKRTSYFYALRLAIAALVLISQQVTAQNVYYENTSTTGTFTDLSDGTLIDFAGSDDLLTEQITLPFTFKFFGADRNAFKASTNGFITFDVTSNESRYTNDIGSCVEPIIAPLWDDLGPAGTGVASYGVTGSAPNRIFTIQYLNWHWPVYNETGTISFQIKLYETTNVIQFIYREEAPLTVYVTASIGIMDAVPGRFYSLYSYFDGSLAPFPINYNNDQPGDGETYTFTPATPPGMPTQASLLSVANITESAADLEWTKGNGDFELIAVREKTEGSTTLDVADGTSYNANDDLGNGWKHQATTIEPNDNTYQFTGLHAGYTYQVRILDFNGMGGFQKYNTGTATGNPIEFTTDISRPAFTSTLSLYHRGSTSVRLHTANDGDGEFRAIFVKAANTDVLPDIADSVHYQAGTFGAGSQVGTSGWYCVFRGLTDVVELTGLPSDTDFTVAMVDFNGPPGKEQYLVSPELLHFSTFHAKTAAYTFTKSNATFTELTGATALDAIETDDFMAEVPIGFNFLYCGESFSTLRASSNGFLTFNLTAPASSYHTSQTQNRLSDNYFSPMLAPLWDDLSGEGGQASYKTEGTSGNRIFTIEFKNWKWNYTAAAPVISMQVKLYESDNRVEYRYRAESGEVNNGSASIGLSFLDLDQRMPLTSSGPDATVEEIYETALINQKPVTGQVFTFTPGPVKLAQTITFDAVEHKIYHPTNSFLLHASSSSGLPVTFTSIYDNVLISGDTVWTTGTGSVYIKAHQEGNDVYHPAQSVENYFYIDRATDTLYFEAFPETKYAQGKTIELNVTAYSGQAVEYSISNTSVVSIDGNVLTILQPGVVDITAWHSGGIFYYSAYKTQTLVVVPGDQVIEFEPLGERPFSVMPIQLTGTTNAGLPITYVSSNPDVVSVAEGAKLEIKAMGTAMITASAEGNSKYSAAENVVRGITIIKGEQTINFPVFENMKALGEVIVLDSLSSELLPVTYTTEDNEVVQIDGNVVTVVGRGAAIITATQGGNAMFNAAETVNRTLIVKNEQTITFEIADKTVGEASFALSGTASSGMPLEYVIIAGDISFFNDLVVLGAPGRAAIKAIQQGDITYDSVSVTAEFCVNPLPPDIGFSGENENGIELISSMDFDNKWYLDGEPLNETAQEITVSASGAYTVTRTLNGCESVHSEAYILMVTGTENSLQHTVALSPNPVKDVFYIDARDNGKSDVAIEMYDVIGRKLETWTGRGRITCNIARYESGNYVVHVRTNAGVVTGKVIKE